MCSLIAVKVVHFTLAYRVFEHRIAELNILVLFVTNPEHKSRSNTECPYLWTKCSGSANLSLAGRRKANHCISVTKRGLH